MKTSKQGEHPWHIQGCSPCSLLSIRPWGPETVFEETGAHGHGRGRRSACSLVFQEVPELLEEGVPPLAGASPGA